MTAQAAAQAILEGRTALGIELGSTRIKACLVLADDPTTVLAVGSHAWENRFVDRLWTYAIDDVWAGLLHVQHELREADERHRAEQPPCAFPKPTSALQALHAAALYSK